MYVDRIMVHTWKYISYYKRNFVYLIQQHKSNDYYKEINECINKCSIKFRVSHKPTCDCEIRNK